MITFSNLKCHELFEIQSDIKIICDLQKNDYLKELEENEIEEILYYKRLRLAGSRRCRLNCWEA